ncbi:N-acetyl-gamma-glutamyl-phosphate reductase [Trueperella bernardiae]|uniref:N-acetyl-gamma-glutamyl-phosphate reductase n=1 Tax=Trueperella bernardiae TaxID=59561 RepID=UPI0025566158|nr:N-acetyl-gamma-glutamyl-phosphate reductase [Trueperella bernardiae]WIM07121.1 N-acetyl-gamma-glutamyl-phosphate reductase [Trueperella bernardiae]
MTYSVAIAGVTGYAGGEVARVLAAHPDMKVATVAAHSSRGTLGEHQRHLWPLRHLEIQSLEAEVLADHDVVVLGLPHGASAAITAQIEQINPDALIIDLGADHRLTDPVAWERYYHSEAAEAWTYGMPELIRATGLTQRELLAATRRIAAPGCNASAVTFAVQPAIAAGLASGEDIVAILSVGYSGAGKSPKTHLLASEAIESATPYAVGGTHRHIPEIAQNLITAGAPTVSLSFTPVLVPMSRGILATVSIPVEGVSPERVLEAYRGAYADEPFVTWSPDWPSTGIVAGSNLALVHAELDADARRITAICAIDNLVKGTAGAATQSMNLVLGLPETTGLSQIGVAP